MAVELEREAEARSGKTSCVRIRPYNCFQSASRNNQKALYKKWYNSTYIHQNHSDCCEENWLGGVRYCARMKPVRMTKKPLQKRRAECPPVVGVYLEKVGSFQLCIRSDIDWASWQIWCRWRGKLVLELHIWLNAYFTLWDVCGKVSGQYLVHSSFLSPSRWWKVCSPLAFGLCPSFCFNLLHLPAEGGWN